ncbi:MAG: sensor domain-containing diguanylate cyclase [Acidobacteriota bacterium]|jgi:diguanylate cyclase (GGDEF)-like protein|nr:sensor domain-containing diguanylate cyclase [Acidobacteriota bacterium]
MATGGSRAKNNVRDIGEAKACRKDRRRDGRRADEAQKIFDSFLDCMEIFAGWGRRSTGRHPMIEAILEHVQSESCLLHLSGDAGDGLQIAASAGDIRDIDLYETGANKALVEKAFRSGAPFLDNDCSCDLRLPFGNHGVTISSVFCHPITRGTEKIGVLELVNKLSGTFTDADRMFVEKAVRPLGVALAVSREFENSQKLAITDDLTGLYNSRYLKKYLEIDVKRCLRYKKKVSLLFIDVDGFKQVNDTYGHLTGSRVLAEMGKVFRQMIRETDIVARYGGDEFVIVLPETPLAGALTTAERIRKKVEEYDFAAWDARIRLTVSLGVASYPRHALTAEGLINKADAAMYRAKESLRNNIKAAV